MGCAKGRVWSAVFVGLGRAVTAFILVASCYCSHAAFMSYSSETLWQAAAAPTALEDFESYAVGAQISTLVGLGIDFDVLEGGGYPAIYQHGSDVTGYGRKQLGNFPNGTNSINRWDDIVLRPSAGYDLYALGFFNGDGQYDTFRAYAYDASDQLLGSIGAYTGNFAGFTSDVPVAYVSFDGNTGDGWNHLDGLQTGVALSGDVPEPGSFILLSIGCAVLCLRRWGR